MALNREQDIPAKAKPKAGPTNGRSGEGPDRQAAKTALLALQPFASAGKRHTAEPIQISRDPDNQAPAIGQTVVYRVNLPVNGTYHWNVVNKNSGFQQQRGNLSQLGRPGNEWAITWSEAGDYDVFCEVLSLPQAREGHPVPLTVKHNVHVSYASSVAHQAVLAAVAQADGATSYEKYNAQRKSEHAEMTGKGASPFANEQSEAFDPFIGAMPIHGPVVLEGKSHEQTYVLNYWKGDLASLKWIVIPRSPDAKGQRRIQAGHGAAPTFSFTEPGLYDVICIQRVTKQSRTGGTNEEFAPVTATVQAILSANGKQQANELRKKIAHADALIAKIAKDKETHQSRAVAITAVHVAASGNKIDHLPLFIGPSAEHNDEFVVVDLRPGIARSEHVGASPEAALKAFEAFAEKNYPKGSVNLHISANGEHIAPQHRSFETQSKIHWDHVGEQVGWISMGLLLSGLGLMAAGVTAPVAMIMFGAAAVGTVAAAATLKGHIDEGASAKQYTIDVMQLAAGLAGFRAFGNLAAYAMQVPNVSKSMIAVEFGLNSGSIGLMSTDVAEELVKVNSDATLSEDERDTRRWQIALNMLGQAGFLWLGYHGAKNDFKITNQVRVVRPDELERRAAAPRKHEPDIDELSPARRRNPRRRGEDNARNWAGQTKSYGAPAERIQIESGSLLHHLNAIERRAQVIDWEHLTQEQRLQQSKQLIDQVADRMTANGYRVEKAIIEGSWTVNILSLSGRAGTFYRRMQQVSPDTTPTLRYDPVRLANAGFTRYDSVSNVVELNGASLSLTEDGFLATLKHEFRHARQAALRKEGRINSSHGWIMFAEEAPRENLPAYREGFTLDEIRVYSMGQQDTINSLRRIRNQLQSNPHLVSDALKDSHIESVISQADEDYDLVVSMSHVLEETLDSFQLTRSKITGPGSGFPPDPRYSPETWMEPGYSVEGGSGDFVFKDKNQNPLMTATASVDERSGPQGMVSVSIPAFRQVGSLRQRVTGEDGMELINVPMNKSQYEALRNNPGAMLAYVEQHLVESAKKAKQWREEIVNRQQSVVKPLLKEVNGLVTGARGATAHTARMSLLSSRQVRGETSTSVADNKVSGAQSDGHSPHAKLDALEADSASQANKQAAKKVAAARVTWIEAETDAQELAGRSAVEAAFNESVPKSIAAKLAKLEDSELKAAAANAEKLVDLSNSSSPELRAYVGVLVDNVAQYRLHGPDLRKVLGDAERLSTFPAAGVVREFTNGSGGLGRHFEGKIDGHSVIFKGDRDISMTMDTELRVLDGLRPYGGPKNYGKYRVEDPETGIWRETVAMEKVDGKDLFSLLSMKEGGQKFPFPITQKHVDAIEALQKNLAREGKRLSEVNYGDFMLTPDGRVVPLDMFVETASPQTVASGMVGTDGRTIHAAVTDLASTSQAK